MTMTMTVVVTTVCTDTTTGDITGVQALPGEVPSLAVRTGASLLKFRRCMLALN